MRDTESSTPVWASLQEAAVQVLQLIDIRLALLIGVAAFMLAVGFDSSGNAAAAADLMTPSALVPVTAVERSEAGMLSGADIAGASTFDDNAQLRIARRLRHGSLTGAILTSNRMTDAHFFTDLPTAE